MTAQFYARLGRNRRCWRGCQPRQLLCSAGIPAVYTQVLALSALPGWQYYFYLVHYILVFLLDDLVVFVTAMATLQASGLTAYSRPIVEAVLIGLGTLLVFCPKWLKFGVG